MQNTTVASEACKIRWHLEECNSEIELLEEPIKRVARQIDSKLAAKLREAETSESEDALDCAVRQMELLYGLLGRQSSSVRVRTAYQLVATRTAMQERVLEKELAEANYALAQQLFNRAAGWIEDAAGSMYESTQDTSLRLANCALDRCHDALQADSHGVKILEIIAEAVNGHTVPAAPTAPTAPDPVPAAATPAPAPPGRSWRNLWRVQSQQPPNARMPVQRILQTNELQSLEESIHAVAGWLVDSKQHAQEGGQKSPTTDCVARCIHTLVGHAEMALKGATDSYLSGAPVKLHLPRIRAILETVDALTGHATRSTKEHVKAACFLRTVTQAMHEMEQSPADALNQLQIDAATKHIQSACQWLEEYGSTELQFWSIAESKARLAYREAVKAQAALNNAEVEKRIHPRTGTLEALRQSKS